MGVFLQQVNKSFQIFCLWLLSCGDIGVGTKVQLTEEVFKPWFKYYKIIFENEEKVVKVEPRPAIGYTTFMAFYIFYLANKTPNIKIAVIEKNKKILSLLQILDNLILDRFDYAALDSTKLSIGNKLVFSNGSIVKTFNPTTYNLKTMEEIEFVFFDYCEIKNLEKLNEDIYLALTSEEIKKMVLTITNDISTEFTEIKTKKI